MNTQFWQKKHYEWLLLSQRRIYTRDVEAEERKFFRFHIGYLTWRITCRKMFSISQCGLNGEVALYVWMNMRYQ